MLRNIPAVVVMLALLSTTASAKTASTAASATTTTKSASNALPSGPHAIVLETTQGQIVIELNETAAPKTCANFVKLANQGFYNGTYFHRVIGGFMIQGGDPNTKDADPTNDGMGGPGYTVPAEIGLPHVRGAVATARQGDGANPKRDSSGSQFFIDLAKLSSLDQGGYTVFGQVIQGMDAVDKIAAFAQDASLPSANGGGRNPGKKAVITKARVVSLASVKQAAPDSTKK